MKITKEDIAVIEGDTMLSRWIQEEGRLDIAHVDRRILNLIEPGNTVVDVGAALGDHTILYAQAVGPTGKVYAFEANPRQVECLKYNMRNLPQVHVFGVALGSADGLASLVEDPNVSGSHLVHGSGNIPVITLDGFLNGQPVHYMKIDVEGDELAVLNGAKDTISKYRPKLLIEVHEGHLARIGRSEKDILDFLSAFDYNHSQFIIPCSGQYDLLAEPLQRWTPTPEETERMAQ